MKLITRISDLRCWRERIGRSAVGFVPTMGALHEGHLSLVHAARKENNRVVVSVFVNPMQFGPKEDFKKYPRNLNRDRELLSKEKIDVLFCPSVREIYPEGSQTKVQLNGLSRGLCGRSRPHFFAGVTTVVSKLFHLVQPTRGYFGAKDYQQAQVIKRMVQDLNFPVEIKVLPTVREADGLAMSSRNAYLSPLERRQAPVMNLSLDFAERLIRGGLRDVSRIQQEIRDFLRPFISKIDYVEVVHPETLTPIQQISGSGLLAIACYIGKTRLIDNRVVRT